MKQKQLALPLWEALHSAQRLPEHVHLDELLGQMEQAIAELPTAEQLQVAGEALLRVTEVYATRAEVLMTAWEDAYRDPVVAPGFFADVVRQTMAVDLTELMEPKTPRKSRTKRTPQAETADGSIAAPVDKTAALALVEQLDAEAATEAAQKQQVLAVAHDEDVRRWSQAIDQWLQAAPEQSIAFAQLCNCLAMPWVEVWLGLLLGGFALEQRGEFYGSSIWIKRSGASATEI